MRVLRAALAIVVAVGAGYFVYNCCWKRFLCNRTELRLQSRVESTLKIMDEPKARFIARQTLDHVSTCMEVTPGNVNLYMIRAAALRILGRPAEAIADYQHALTLDRRPEIYVNLGGALEEAGREDEAIRESIVGVFLQPAMLDAAPDALKLKIDGAIKPLHAAARRRELTADMLRDIRVGLGSPR